MNEGTYIPTPLLYDGYLRLQLPLRAVLDLPPQGEKGERRGQRLAIHPQTVPLPEGVRCR